MAGPVVHNKFFYDSINESNVDLDIYMKHQKNCNIYSQGHDLLLYIEPWNFVSNRQVSLLLSNYKFREFIYSYLKNSSENDSLYKDDNISLFIYGYISHHILDSYFHPFIMQYCEDYLPVKNKEWIHGRIETLYDTYFLEKYLNEKASQAKFYKDFKFTPPEGVELVRNIQTASVDTYNYNKLGRKMNLSFKTIELFMYLYRYDANNFKKNLGSLADMIVNIGSKDFFYDESKLSELSQYMNLSNEEWINIWTRNSNHPIKSIDNFEEIYAKALETTKNVINELEEMKKDQRFKLEDIYDVVPDRSAITGLECGRDLPFVKKKRGIRYE